MSNIKKLMMSSAGGTALNVEDVFSVYMYEGNGSSQDITNGIDLANEGGIVWFTQRDGISNKAWADTVRGNTKWMWTNSTPMEQTTTNPGTGDITSFNTDGYSVGINNQVNINASGNDYISWTFRKAPNFLDIVTYTGNNVNNRAIPHNLGTTPGFIITKGYSTTGYYWVVHHKDLDTNGYLFLNETSQQITAGLYSSTPTSTDFYISNNNNINKTGVNYVSYVFAHHGGTGTFGTTGDQDIIHCGSYTGNASTDGPFENMGFEPQWLMIKKKTGSSEDWFIFNSSVGIPFKNQTTYTLKANASDKEADNGVDIHVRPDGFKVTTTSSKINQSGEEFIYVAIRRPMAEPENASDVFATDTWGGTVTAPPAFYSGFPVDAAFTRSWATTANNTFTTRLTSNKGYFTNVNTNGTFGSVGTLWDLQDGFWDTTSSVSTYLGAMWKRAPKFFEVVTYDGNNSAGRTINHNLKVAPEMMLVRQNAGSDNWHVYHSGADPTAPETKYAMTNSSAAFASATGSFNMWNSTAPTATQFTLGNYISVNSNGSPHVALLFASLDGISKVGTYTGSASDQNIDCGFSNGAKFVLIKAVSSSTEWYLFTDVMGITSGTSDPLIVFNDNTPRDESYTSSTGAIFPYSSGFGVNGGNTEVNNSDGRTYIFYAVA